MEFPTNLPLEDKPRLKRLWNYRVFLRERLGHDVDKGEFFDQILNDTKTLGWWSNLFYRDMVEITRNPPSIMIAEQGQVRLTHREMDILYPLAEKPHQIVTHPEFVDLWGESWDERWLPIIRFNVSRLRQKLKNNGLNNWIHTYSVRGDVKKSGYFLKKPD
jgi:hypothetical protein